MVSCKKCLNRRFDPTQGLVCKLTNKIADFEGSCKDFDHDATVKEEVQVEDRTHEEIVSSLPDEVLAKLKPHQDLQYAIVGGLSSSLLAALLWAVITVSTQYQISYMAIGVGFLVGMGVRYFGAGIDPVFGYVGAFFSLLGCLVGNLFSQVGLIAQEQYLGYLDTLLLLDFDIIIEIFQETFNPIDLIFYGLALYAGYRFSFRPIPADIRYGKDFTPAYSKFRLPAVLVSASVVIVCLYTFSRGISGPQTFYYESGKIMSVGEFKNGQTHGKWTYYYENGTTQLQGEYVDGLEQGQWEWYADNGKIVKKGFYKDGLLDGVWFNYYDNGVLMDSSNYAYGRLHGQSVLRYETGQISRRGRFVRDRQEGPWEFYFVNGNKSAEGSFSKGISSGLWKVWNFDGQLIQEVEHLPEQDIRIINCWSPNGEVLVKDGSGVFKTYYANGTMAQEGKVKEGKKVGLWKSYFANGKLQEEGTYEENIYKLVNSWSLEGSPMVVKGEGEYESYYEETEDVFEKGMVSNGLRDGLWESFHESGAPLQMAAYSAGKLHGRITNYHENGNVVTEGSFSQGKLDGAWNWYYESGLLQSSASFKNGKKEGSQVFFSESGVQVKEELYESDSLVSERLLFSEI